MNTLDKRIRVAFVITELDVGGAERCLVNVATRLNRQRFEPRVYCLAPRPSDPDLVERLESSKVEVQFLGASSIRQFVTVRARLREQMAAWALHILQSFLFHANVLAASVVTGQRGPALVLGIRVADPSRWRAVMEKIASRRAQKVVCVSRSVAEFARRRMGIPAEMTQVIGNGIDMSEFASCEPADLQSLGIAPARRLIVFIGRLHQQKGIDSLLREMPAAFEALPDHDLLIVGDGPMFAELKRLVSTQGLGGRVFFAGRQKDIPRILARSEILVLLSRWEGMPNVVLEAMAAGKPVLVSEVEGVAEVLGPLAQPQTVPMSGDPRFLERLIHLVSSPDRLATLGQQNRDHVANCFDIRDRVQQYEQLYESLSEG